MSRSKWKGPFISKSVLGGLLKLKKQLQKVIVKKQLLQNRSKMSLMSQGVAKSLPSKLKKKLAVKLSLNGRLKSVLKKGGRVLKFNSKLKQRVKTLPTLKPLRTPQQFKKVKRFNTILKKPFKLKIKSRNSVISAGFINQLVLIYTGLYFRKILITREKVGYKFGTFVLTRQHYKAKQKKSKQNKIRK